MRKDLVFGNDEISQASIRIVKSPGREKGFVEIERENGIVNLHRMKSLFCDGCIDGILKIVEGQEIEYKHGDYEIKIEFISKGMLFLNIHYIKFQEMLLYFQRIHIIIL